MRNYVKIGEVNRLLAQRRAQERKEKLLCRLADFCTGMMIGVLIGLAVYMIHRG